MKILYVTTIGGTMRFFKGFIYDLLEDGHTIDIATNETESMVPECYRDWGCKIYSLSCSRSPFKKENLDAIKQVKALVTENKYDIIHCHTPIAAACTRISCRKAREQGTKVIYTAHGFHFYKGAPLKNWLAYYPVEWLCSCWTDMLITINKEDYALAQRRLKVKRIEYVPGVGIDLGKFANMIVNKVEKRNEIGVPQNAFMLLSVGELNTNKNHETVIRAVAEINRSDVHYVIAGKGELKDYLEKLAGALGVGERVHLLGFRTDVAELYKTADIFAHPSFREGLPVAVMEAMASGLPVTCSKIRGNTDLIDENGGMLFDPHNLDGCRSAVEKMLTSDKTAMGLYNTKKVNMFEIDTIVQQMETLYEGVKGE